MTVEPLKIYARRAPFEIGPYEFQLWGIQNAGSKRSYVQTASLKTVEFGEPIEPFLSVSQDVAQCLMDELWQCGLRPTEGTGSAGAMAATQKHLEDMRKLVFRDVPSGIDKYPTM